MLPELVYADKLEVVILLKPETEITSGAMDNRLFRLVGELLFHPLEAFPVIDLLGLMAGLPEGDRPAMLGNLLEPGRPAVVEHEVRLGDPQFLLFLLRFHHL